MTGEISNEEMAAALEQGLRKGGQAPSCLLNQDAGLKAEYEGAIGEWTQSTDEKMSSHEQVLESVDGMVGNYEFEVVEKRKELQEAADDYTRILAELQELETAAGIGGRSAAGGGAASSADVGEGAGVEEIE